MSPEQARGRRAGPQADVWAFGVVLWEMLTGRRLCAGETLSDTLASVLRQEIGFAELPREMPSGVRRTLELCLQRDPRRRLRHIGDAALLLTAPEAAPTTAAATSLRRPVAAALAVAVAAASLAAGAAWWLANRTPRRGLVTAGLEASAGTTLRLDRGLALSPDGQQIVFAAGDAAGESQLWIRSLDSAAARPLAGTDGADYPFWSPDGRHLAFFAGGRLKRVPVGGGPVEVEDPRGGSWSDRGEIVFAPYWRGGLEMIAAAGGPRRKLTEADPEKGELSHRFPWFLPGGRELVFLSQSAEGGTARDRSTIDHLELASGRRSALAAANSSMAWSPSGHLLYWQGGSLLAQPVDLRARRARGDYLPLVEGVQYSGNELAAFAISAEGTLVYGTGSGAVSNQILRVDLEGRPIAELTAADSHAEPAFSPDGGWLAYRLRDDVWVHDLTAGGATRFTFEGGYEWTPVWSPDGEWIAYASSPANDGMVIARKRSSGVGEPEELLRVEDAAGLAAWPDDRRLLFHRFSAGHDFDVWSLDPTTGNAELLLRTPFLDADAAVSPDGRWLAYGSNERELFEVYVRGLCETGGRWQISPGGGEQPRWSPDGRTLYYISEQARMIAVPVLPGESFRTGTPVDLFATSATLDDVGDYDVHPDGRSFAITRTVEAAEQLAVLVIDWPRLLRHSRDP